MERTHPTQVAEWLLSVRKWFEDNVPADDGAAYRKEWSDFDNSATPVLTLFGAYDSGKSSLLRRLLVDSGTICPDWLTISGRHETFEVSSVEAAGLAIRDTPGLSPEADDPRGIENNRRALNAAALTDILLVVMPPQLATAELETVRRQLDQYPVDGSLRFAVSRFDEAGVDPTGDRGAYDELAQSKVSELRRAFELSGDVPVSVVAPDPWQMAGEELQPDPAVWDDCRTWDGIADLRRELESLPVRAAAFREGAAIRYWKRAVRDAAKNIGKHYNLTLSSFTTATQAVKRTEQLMERLDELKRAVASDLDGVLESVLDQALRAGIADSARLRERTVDALHDWYGRSGAKLALFIQDADLQIEHQMSRAGWRDLEELLGRELRPPGPNNETRDDAGPLGGFSLRLRQLNTSLGKSMQEVKVVLSKTTKDFSPARIKAAPAISQALPSAVVAGDVLVALGPTLFDIFDLVAEIRRERDVKRADGRRAEAIEVEVAELRSCLTKKALSTFVDDINIVRMTISRTRQSLVDLVDTLAERVETIEKARAASDFVIKSGDF